MTRQIKFIHKINKPCCFVGITNAYVVLSVVVLSVVDAMLGVVILCVVAQTAGEDNIIIMIIGSD